MTRILITILATVLAMALWTGTVFIGTSEGWWKTPITDSAASKDFVEPVRDKVAAEHRGNLGFALIEKGKVIDQFSVSSGEPVDENSIYQVASLGKWLTAWGIMVLVEDGLVDLDAPVSKYLKRWNLPDSGFDHSGVTIGRLLSHTAGLDDRLGYDGFDTPEDVQTLEASLTRAEDASPGKSGIVKVGVEPGAEWKYSGGGYTILQLVIEEVSGLSFADHMKQRIFEPLGMTRTTFDHSDAITFGLAENFTTNGKTEPFRWYTALGATSLFTSPADMARFVAVQSPGGAQSVLSQETLAAMASSHATSMGADVWGLGVMLFAPNNRDGFIVGHDGNNEPAINTAVRFDPATGDGIVVLETGSSLLATEIASEWVFWKTGNVDNLAFAMALESMFRWILAGCAIILLIGLVMGWRQWQNRRIQTGLLNKVS
ncbi:serine hydrolase [Sphingorhabdus sp. Alg231-15]|uniref:serine hydrolase n=1 Tax=Sphingorhabdus sp. Alg231-15 TaxID=1922222 RepID=UPI000D554B01